MDGRLLAIAALPILAVAGIVYWLTGALGPMPGYFASILIYNLLILLPLCLWKLGLRGAWQMLQPRRPGALVAVAIAALPLAVLAQMIASGQAWLLPASAFALILLVSITNGTLEELFWRGALIDDTTVKTLVVATTAFTLWHFALLPARGVEIFGGPAAMIVGAAVLGSVWMLSRVQSGTVGSGAISHVALNLFAFSDLWGQHLPT